ncbi:MAG TPA: hypothetical protein VH595_13955 [Verrucomicrobiae bacterium]|jgi:hypothetical protein|nr:hypothetical protein [Verrucomicrobiae bacterium]
MRVTIKNTYSTALCALLLLSGLPASFAQGNLVINGDFDTSAIGWTLVGAGTSWEASKGDPAGDVIVTALAGSPATVPSASQTIDGLVPGDTYAVTGDFENVRDWGGGSPTADSFGVAINGVYMFEAAQEQPGMWNPFDFSFTASSTSETLSLAAEINGTGVDYEIDNVGVQAVPEESSLWLAVIGGISTIAYVRIKHRPV